VLFESGTGIAIIALNVFNVPIDREYRGYCNEYIRVVKVITSAQDSFSNLVGIVS